MSKRTEALAKSILEAVLPGPRARYVEDQSAGQHDFDLEYTDGRTVPLEVTAAADANIERTYAAIKDARKGGNCIQRTRSGVGWFIHPRADANINAIRENADEYLVAIEADGLNQFFAYTDAESSPAVWRILEDLGIESGRVMQWKHPGEIRMALPGGGGLVDPHLVVVAVETEAWKVDNRRKLSSLASERHLFVEIDPNNARAWVAIRDEVPPNAIASLPDEITHMWIAAYTGNADWYVVWHAPRGCVFEDIGFVNVRTGERQTLALEALESTGIESRTSAS
jgi:hypothetical protein